MATEKEKISIDEFIPQSIRDGFLAGAAYDRNTGKFDNSKELSFSMNTNTVLNNKFASNCSDFVTDYIVAVKKEFQKDPELWKEFKQDYNKYMTYYAAAGTDGIAKFFRETYQKNNEKLDTGLGSELASKHEFKNGDVILYHSGKVKNKEFGHSAMVFEENGKMYVTEMRDAKSGWQKTELNQWLKERADKEMMVGNVMIGVEKRLNNEETVKNSINNDKEKRVEFKNPEFANVVNKKEEIKGESKVEVKKEKEDNKEAGYYYDKEKGKIVFKMPEKPTEKPKEEVKGESRVEREVKNEKVNVTEAKSVEEFLKDKSVYTGEKEFKENCMDTVIVGKREWLPGFLPDQWLNKTESRWNEKCENLVSGEKGYENMTAEEKIEKIKKGFDEERRKEEEMRKNDHSESHGNDHSRGNDNSGGGGGPGGGSGSGGSGNGGSGTSSSFS